MEGTANIMTDTSPTHHSITAFLQNTHGDHGGGEEPPGEELEEDDHQCMIHTRLPDAGALKHKGHHRLYWEQDQEQE
ncbi:hypothetical protein E2C01_003776 [Portunus trituberculatus]|uniref:Uncharacterized protein n=1 Tax=Portunus trituberculatus TaxID=210409 RepID=A0A5B7CNL1_PORTR|nr:hypothetical protein [Portunus trituberculatus]